MIKIVHTLAWAFFVFCIMAIPLLAWQGSYRKAALFSVIVLLEVGILIYNRWSCPLTAVAARYTNDRRPNFDIYLPQWLAQYNKHIFGTIYVVSVIFAVARWLLEK